MGCLSNPENTTFPFNGLHKGLHTLSHSSELMVFYTDLLDQLILIRLLLQNRWLHIHTKYPLSFGKVLRYIKNLEQGWDNRKY